MIENVDIGSSCNLICIVNVLFIIIQDDNAVRDIRSKAGQDLKVKDIQLYDPEFEWTVEVSVWERQFVHEFKRGVYYLNDIVVSEYKDQKKYSLGRRFFHRELPNHRFNNYLDKVKDDDFVVSAKKLRKKVDENADATMCIKEFLSEVHDAEVNKSLWFVTTARIRRFRPVESCKHYYQACPSCSKKVQQAENSECVYCGKPYDVCSYRYLLNFTITDDTGDIFVTTFNQLSEYVLGDMKNDARLEGREFVKMDDEEKKKVFRQHTGDQYIFKILGKR